MNIMIKHLPYFMQPYLGPDLVLSFSGTDFTNGTTDFGESLPTAAGRRRCLFVYLFMSTK